MDIGAIIIVGLGIVVSAFVTVNFFLETFRNR